MTGGAGRRVLALVAAELRSYRREIGSTVSYALLAVSAGAIPVIWARVASDDDEAGVVVVEGPASPTEPCPTDVPVVLAPGLPDWVVRAPLGIVSDEGDVLVRSTVDRGMTQIEVVDLADDSDATESIEACVVRAEVDERIERAAAFGVVEDPKDNVEVVWWAEGVPALDRFPETGRLGVTAATLAAAFCLGLMAELVARVRSSGLLETLLLVPVRPVEIVASLVLAGTVLVSVGLGLGLGVHVGLATWLGEPVGWSPEVGLTLPLVVTLLVHGVWANADVPDLRAATIRTLRVSFELQFLVLLAVGIAYRFGPAAGALVPIGGLGLATAGWGHGGLALLSSAAWCALLGARAVHRLTTGTGNSAFDEGIPSRHLEGRYGPEVAILFFAGTAGTLAWVPTLLLDDPQLAVLLGQAAFFVVPAVGVGAALGLEAKALLQWRLPSLRAWLAVPFVTAGTLSLGTLTFRAWERWVGVDPEIARSFGLNLPGPGDLVGVLIFSLVPGICEELMFRGAIFGLLRRRGGRYGPLVVQALLFGLAHVLAFRILPTASIGLLIGFLALRSRSIFPGMAVHVLNNALALTVLTGALRLGDLPSWVLGAGATIGALAAWASGEESKR